MGYMYEVKANKNFTKLASFLLCWMLFYSVSFANECPVPEFKQYAEKLDKNKIESVNSLKDHYKEIVSDQSLECRSILFGDFRHYYDQMTQAYIASVEEKLNVKYPLSFQKEEKYKTEFTNIGLRLNQSEGMYYVETDSEWFLKEFATRLPGWTQFLKQWNYEDINSFTEDGVLQVSFEELRKRVVFWESFLNDYPDFPERSRVQEILSIYLSFYLSGLHNTISFSHIPIVSSDIRKSYENFLKFNQQSNYYGMVKSQYSILKDNNFKIDKKTSKNLDINYQKNVKK